MKRLVLILLTVMMLTACGQAKENIQGAVYMNITAEEYKHYPEWARQFYELRLIGSI